MGVPSMNEKSVTDLPYKTAHIIHQLVITVCHAVTCMLCLLQLIELAIVL